MAGKYAGVIDRLPRILGTEAPYQEKINQTKDIILGASQQLTPEEENLHYKQVEESLEIIGKHVDKINEHMLQVSGGRRHGTVFARMYAMARKIKAVSEAQEKRVNLLVVSIEQLLVDQYEAEGTRTLGLQDGGTVRVQYEPHATVEDRDAFREWCMNNDLTRSLSLPWQTTNAIIKERLLAGLAEPPGVKANSKHKVVYTKG